MSETISIYGDYLELIGFHDRAVPWQPVVALHAIYAAGDALVSLFIAPPSGAVLLLGGRSPRCVSLCSALLVVVKAMLISLWVP